MKQEAVPAVIYRLSAYSENSAVASAITPLHGKIKLFINNAFTKRGAPMCLVPGVMSFNLKDGDLHRFYSFSHDPNYYHYVMNTDISIRMSVCFDFFDHLFYARELSAAFWKMILKFDASRYREVLLYTLYRALKDSGYWFFHPCACGKLQGELTLSNGEIYCERCAPSPLRPNAINIDESTAELLEIFSDVELYREKKFTADEEIRLVKLFEKHITAVAGNDTLKSLKVFYALSEAI